MILPLTIGGSHQTVVTALREVRPEFPVSLCADRDSTTGRDGLRIQTEGNGLRRRGALRYRFRLGHTPQRLRTARRVAPARSAYCFDEFEADPGKLAAWVAGGLWGDNPDKQRRAKGFNRA